MTNGQASLVSFVGFLVFAGLAGYETTDPWPLVFAGLALGHLVMFALFMSPITRPK